MSTRTRTCTKCHESKPLDQYQVIRGRGMEFACGACERARKRAYWHENRDALLEKQRARAKTPEARLKRKRARELRKLRDLEERR